MAQLATLANAIVAVIPAAVLFFVAYGRYDGSFKDNVVFLYFIGGLVMGAFLGFLSLLSLVVVVAILAVVLLAIILPLGLVVGINRRKWQGDPHAVFNGGAFGLGVSVMFAFTFLVRLYKETSTTSVGQGLLFAAGLAGLFFALGLLAGDGVRRRRPFLAGFTGVAIILAPLVFVEEFHRQQAWLFPVLLTAYGLIAAVAAERRLMSRGLSDEARRQRRRQRRGGQEDA